MFYQEIFSYLLLASLLMGIFYCYYFVALRQETSFRFNRFYLLISTGLSLIFPLIKIPSQAAIDIPTFHTLAEVMIVANGVSVEPAFISWEMILYSLYILGIGASFLLFGQRFWQMLKFVRQADTTEKHEDYTLIFTKGKLSTSSFFRFLFWDDSKNFDTQAEAQIRAHELCHIRQGHSYDIMFIECIQLFLWFNPFIYLIRRDLVQTHEYLADRAALGIGTTKNYKRLMLSQALNTRLVFSHTFFQSPIKNRINMLNNESNQRKLVVVAILLLPILGGLFFFSSFVKKIDIHVMMESPDYEEVALEETMYETEMVEEIEEVEKVLEAADKLEELEVRVEELDRNFQEKRKGITEESEVILKETEREVQDIAELKDRLVELEDKLMERKAELQGDPDINTFVPAEKEPKPTNMRDIQKAIGYPQIARDAGIEGNVVVRVLVDADGKYLRHKVINQVHPILTHAVETQVSKLRFQPAIKDGKPTKFWVNIPFNFKLLN